ncbi:hypothetical protein [Aerococcus urinaeequi]|uniref:Uncharacterized protein n=1 Tax=Aerococcus urinaeequi TaxID=51665 RepID=A0A7M1KUC3_9LACT|nr:hypothetical protein [Aerococcus urinaeequi]QOQ78659.1 hypothetical protein IMX20_06600 [Aerococcus urinaeequi]
MTSEKVIGSIFFYKKRGISIIIKLITTIDRIGDSLKNKFINTTSELKDENIIFEDKVEEMTFKNIKSLVYFGKLDVNPQYCPACGCVKKGNSIVKNESKDQESR